MAATANCNNSSVRLRLHVLTGSLAGKEVAIDPGDSSKGGISIGRDGGGPLVFEDATVSAHHASIEAGRKGFLIRDQKSKNGTYRNGRRVRQARLRSGDLLTLGRTGPAILVETSRGSATESIAPSLTTRLRFRPIKEDDRETKTLDYIGLGGFLLLSVIMAILMICVFLLELGPGGSLVGILVAFLPLPLYLVLFLWLDRFDPEPWWALASAFAWGALFAILPAYIVTSTASSITASMAGEEAGSHFAALVSAPLIEELSKGFGVILALVLLRREFDGVVDGLVYSGIIALGFSTVENVLYYGRAFLAPGSGRLLLLLFLRGILSPFSHALFTAPTGIGCGIVREAKGTPLRFAAPFVGMAMAVLLHLLWNFVASLAIKDFVVLYLVVWVPLFLGFFGVMAALGSRERSIVRESLGRELRHGLLSPPQYLMASSLLRRLAWIARALPSPEAVSIRRRFLGAVTKLALCYHHLDQAQAAGAETISLGRIPRLQAEVRRLGLAIDGQTG